jgi:hypothetical protein
MKKSADLIKKLKEVSTFRPELTEEIKKELVDLKKYPSLDYYQSNDSRLVRSTWAKDKFFCMFKNKPKYWGTQRQRGIQAARGENKYLGLLRLTVIKILFYFRIRCVYCSKLKVGGVLNTCRKCIERYTP